MMARYAHLYMAMHWRPYIRLWRSYFYEWIVKQFSTRNYPTHVGHKNNVRRCHASLLVTLLFWVGRGRWDRSANRAYRWENRWKKNFLQKITENVKKRKKRDKNKKNACTRWKKNVTSVIFRRTDKFEMPIGLIYTCIIGQAKQSWKQQ